MFFFYLIFFIGYVQSKERQLIILPRDIRSCKPGQEQSWDLKNITLLKDADNGESTISGVMVLKETFDEKSIIHLDIFKCMSAEQSSCRNFTSLDDKNFCTDVGDPDKMWQPLMEYVKTIEKSCPIPAGSYKLMDVPFTQVLGEKVVCLPGFWRLEASLRKGTRTLGCIMGYGEIKQKRRTKKKPS